MKVQGRYSCKHQRTLLREGLSPCRTVVMTEAWRATKSWNKKHQQQSAIKVLLLIVRTNRFTNTARMTSIIIMLYDQEVAMDRRRIFIRTLY